ncbi:hypothetical protein [Sulfurimonas sp.]|uniref:hypothetical protein n=1 Tax=Sulfurimonas sp. TaxID=2022749 RepID=UPI0025EBC558|nr:hypothetical protein [Sulfurimonas sp.]
MNKLDSIEIENIKGIGNKQFIVNLFPNKPSIFVAPNGFGKSSIACGFESLKPSKLELDEKNYHLNNSGLVPKLVVTIDSNAYIADNTSNSISSKFDYFVVNSPLYAKCTKRNTGRFTAVSSSLESESIELIATIPDKVDFDYSATAMSEKFGNNGKVLPNIKTNLLNSLDFWYLFSKKIDISHYTKKLTFENPLNLIIERINTQHGSSQVVKDYIFASELSNLSNIVPLKNLAEIIEKFVDIEVDRYLIAIEIAWLSQTGTFKKALEYLLYTRDKLFYNELLSAIDTTRHNISVAEKKKSKSSSKKSLIIEFPSADQMSNGQRDILSFIAQIQKARRAFNKQHCILIIDEVFDYLDDANLVAFQYYITTLIEEFKMQDRFLYPTLLTHLDPAYFKHFSFNKHKLQIRYLASSSTRAPSVFLKMVKHRDDSRIKDAVSKHHFHFHPDEINLEIEFQSLVLKKVWGKSHSFYNEIYKETRNYLQGNDYDAIAVLFAVRIKIEEIVFSLLMDSEHKRIFLDEKNNGTKYKLEYCVEELGISIPETFFLLGLIYNDNLHWNGQRDYETPLISKLENMTIKKMIQDIFS